MFQERSSFGTQGSRILWRWRDAWISVIVTAEAQIVSAKILSGRPRVVFSSFLSRSSVCLYNAGPSQCTSLLNISTCGEQYCRSCRIRDKGLGALDPVIVLIIDSPPSQPQYSVWARRVFPEGVWDLPAERCSPG